jgi:protease I
MLPDNTMAPLEEEEEERNLPPPLRFDLPTREPLIATLNPNVDAEGVRGSDLHGMHVAVLVTTDVEETEILDTTKALRDAGAQVDVISPEGAEVQLMRHDDKTITLRANAALEKADPAQYDATLLPGGTINSDKLRMEENARDFVRALDDAGKPIAAICHAPWLLVSAGLVDQRTLTSYYTLQDDVRNAGGTWLDEEVIVDDNWVTSRSPKDIPAFNREMLRLFADSRAA